MERFGVVGITHHRASAEEIGWFATTPEILEDYRQALGVDELLHLRTCNRVETYWVSHEKVSPDKILRAFGEWFATHADSDSEPKCLLALADSAGFALSGNACHRHLNSMLCGLDSKVLGDEQIVGQFRDALQEARDEGTCGQWLGMLADEALKLSRRIRKQVDYSRLPTSVSEVASEVLRKRIQGRGARIALVGCGEMIRGMAKRLASWNKIQLHFINRTEAKAQQLAQSFGGTWQSLESFQKNPQDFDHLVTATAALRPIISVTMLESLPAQSEQRMVLDLGVPADTERAIEKMAGFERLDVLEVGARAEANQEMGRVLRRKVRPILREGSLHFREKIFRRHLSPVASQLRESIQQRALQEARKWARTRLTHLAPEDVALFEQFALRLADQTVQVPLVALRNTLRELPMGELLLQRLRQAGRQAMTKAPKAGMLASEVTKIPES